MDTRNKFYTGDGRTRAAKRLKDATAFFYEHAGYSYDPKIETQEQGRRRCAVSLARAERDAERKGITFVWDIDEEGCSGCDCGSQTCACSSGMEHTTLYCMAFSADEKPLASLCGICGADGDYRRVVEAELAEEAIAAAEREGQ